MSSLRDSGCQVPGVFYQYVIANAILSWPMTIRFVFILYLIRFNVFILSCRLVRS